MMITWAKRVSNLTVALGRSPTFDELLECATIHQMTPEEISAQRDSWARSEAQWAKDFREGKCERD